MWHFNEELAARADIAPTYRRPFSVWFRDVLWRSPATRAVVGLTGLAILAGGLWWLSQVSTESDDSPSPQQTESPPETPSPAAGALGRGNQISNRYSFVEQPEAFDLTLAAYQEALDLDPDNAAIPAEIARLYTAGMRKGGGVSNLMPEAERWAARAVELEPDSTRVSRMLWDLERARAQPDHP